MSGRVLEHGYGERVTVLDDPFLSTLVARIGAPDTPRTEVVECLRQACTLLCSAAVSLALPSTRDRRATRMHEKHGDLGAWTGDLVDPSSDAVVVDVIRGGIVPSQVFFELLSRVLPEERVRLDHLHMARKVAADGSVSGTDLFGSKIGGRVDQRHLFVPDPMGATGSTAVTALDHYLEHWGRPSSVTLVTLVCTPEFLRAVLAHPSAPRVLTARVDRGLSSEEVLAEVPGVRWDEERGLDDDGYIVPGAGGIGEVLNNSWC